MCNQVNGYVCRSLLVSVIVAVVEFSWYNIHLQALLVSWCRPWSPYVWRRSPLQLALGWTSTRHHQWQSKCQHFTGWYWAFFFKVPHYFIIIIYQIYIRWMLLEGWKIRLSPGEHPLLLARIPEMTDAMCTSLASTMQKKKKKNNCQEAHFLFSSSFFAIPFGHSLHRVHRPSGLFVGFTWLDEWTRFWSQRVCYNAIFLHFTSLLHFLLDILYTLLRLWTRQ